MRNVNASPLCWPAGWKRTDRPIRARFDTSMAVARDGVLDELSRMGVPDWNVIISTNCTLRRDGLPYANQGEPDDPGVAVYFSLNGEDRVIPIDKFDRVRDNMQAIHKIITALRGLNRWGYEQMLHAAFAGFVALPAPEANRHWSEVLGVPRDGSPEVLRIGYQYARRQAHPDKGGSSGQFNAVHRAWQQAIEERGL